MPSARLRITAGLAGAITVVGTVLVSTAPTHADPDIDDVQAKVDRLYHEAEQATERHHDAELRLDDLKADLKDLRADESAQSEKVADLQADVDQALAAQYEGQTISATGQLVLSDDPAAFLSELTTISAYNAHQSLTVDELAREQQTLELRREATEDRAAELKKLEKALAEEKAAAEKKHAEAEELLDDLKAEERARVAEASRSGNTTRMPTDVKASGSAAAVVKFALAQLGDSYVYGAAGPNAWDCSGLTMVAWAQAGVSLPHSSAAQKGYGTPVSSDSLQPGDLVFYYSPISHVGIYIGNGQIVHAANPSTGVVISGVFSMPYSGAVRPG
ncbi:C40 family peptidase [Nocardioides alcanivorans]|uniref:C40 family peptidase n=1 Tax=Nocardioides alcanivorans TaxID=2897352 RepID=UPI001F3991E0|nr:C40 family peptidase [Nocardioides alcanivorans]